MKNFYENKKDIEDVLIFISCFVHNDIIFIAESITILIFTSKLIGSVTSHIKCGVCMNKMILKITA